MENTVVDFSAYVPTVGLKHAISRLIELERRRGLDTGRIDHLSSIAANYIATHPEKGKLLFRLLTEEGRRYALEKLEEEIRANS